MRLRWVLVTAISLPACGRSGFDADGGRDAGGDAAGRANVAFVTSGTSDGVFAPPLAAADASCANAAASAGLPGTFVAWISDAGTNAIDRLAGSRGWVRTDGQPLADTPNSLVAGALFNPLVLDEHGIAISTSDPVWTGTGPDGHLASDCNEWTTDSATIGYAGEDLPSFTAAEESQVICGSAQAHLYCFETGRDVAVAPVATSGGRIAFVGRPRTPADNSQSQLDQLCATDATTAGLTGTFLAAVATTASSISSRFPLDARPWVRVDGTVIATTGARLFDGTTLETFVNQAADGSYDASFGNFLSGATSPYVDGIDSLDCTSWSFTGAGGLALVGNSHTTTAAFWNSDNDTCDQADRVLCLQQ
jgi:hypothetical protein